MSINHQSVPFIKFQGSKQQEKQQQLESQQQYKRGQKVNKFG